LTQINKEIYGQYFTSETIANFMVSLISSQKEQKSILDPGAGMGVFLNSLRSSGFVNVNAYEIDEKLFKVIKEEFKDFKIELLDFLKSPREEKFDIIIGNPPYVHWNDIEKSTLEILTQKQFWKTYINGEWDLLYAFIVWSIEKLNENGELIFIVPYYWFNSTFAYSLREFVSKNGYFDLIIHMGEFKLFPDCAPNNVIFKYIKTSNKEKGKGKIKVIEYNQRTGKVDEILAQIQDFINKKVDSDYIYEGEDFRFFFQDNFTNNLFWSLSHEKEIALVESIEKASTKSIPLVELENLRNNQFIDAGEIEKSVPVNYLLDSKDLKQLNLNSKSLLKLNGQYYSKHHKTHYLKLKQVLNIGVRMVTGFENAFIVDNEFMNNLSPEERTLIIPFTKGKTCKRFWIDDPASYIFADNVKDEKSLEENYPKIYNHLLQYKKELEKRYKSKSTKFYQWATVRNYSIFRNNLEKEKVFVPCLDRHKKSRFSYTTEPYFGSGDVLVITKKRYPLIKESLKYVCAWLNSDKLNKWYKLKGSKRGHRTSYTQTRVEEMPIRLINWDDSEEIEIYNELIESIDLILTNKEFNEKIEEKINNLIDRLIS